MSGPKQYTKTYHIRPNESDRFNELKVVGLIDLLQDMAWEHASRLTLSISNLMDRGMTWVLSRYHIQYLKPVLQGEEVSIKTWPVGIHRLYAVRDFEVRNATNEVVAVATSGWLVLSYPELRPLKPNALLKNVITAPERGVEDDFPPLPKIGEANVEATFPVRWHDLDLNNHVNNSVYPRWALESLPVDILQNYRCREIEIQFVGMVGLGEGAIAKAIPADPQNPYPVFHHQLFNAKTGKEITRLVSRWETRMDVNKFG